MRTTAKNHWVMQTSGSIECDKNMWSIWLVAYFHHQNMQLRTASQGRPECICHNLSCAQRSSLIIPSKGVVYIYICMYMYVYIYMLMYVYIYMYVYIDENNQPPNGDTFKFYKNWHKQNLSTVIDEQNHWTKSTVTDQKLGCARTGWSLALKSWILQRLPYCV